MEPEFAGKQLYGGFSLSWRGIPLGDSVGGKNTVKWCKVGGFPIQRGLCFMQINNDILTF